MNIYKLMSSFVGSVSLVERGEVVLVPGLKGTKL